MAVNLTKELPENKTGSSFQNRQFFSLLLILIVFTTINYIIISKMSGILKTFIQFVLPLLAQLHFNPFDDELFSFDDDNEDEDKVAARVTTEGYKKVYIIFLAIVFLPKELPSKNWQSI